jgi:hypothetical protein
MTTGLPANMMDMPVRLPLSSCVALMLSAALLWAASHAIAQTTTPETSQQGSVRSTQNPIAPFSEPQKGPLQQLIVSALFAGENKPIRSGLVWRVFRETSGGAPELVQRTTDLAPVFSLSPGNYIVHAAYGFASISKRITLRGGSPVSDRLMIGAGGLRLSSAIGDQPIPISRLSYSIYVPVGNNSEGRLLASNLKSGDIILVPEGTYHVVSNYGDTNSIMRADLKVDSGRVTQATLNHRAALVTLKLVNAVGGEALAGTAFSILTPGGDSIREAIGAFPQMVLAEGEYVVIARQEGQVFTREFKVQSGLDRDIEVMAK